MVDQAQQRMLARLRWQSRRGMLELDEILTRYVDKRYLQASPDEQSAFRQLLDYQDPELQQWLLLGVEPDDEALAALISVLRQDPCLW